MHGAFKGMTTEGQQSGTESHVRRIAITTDDSKLKQHSPELRSAQVHTEILPEV